ncbi:MAG: phosphoglycerate kinase, partial [Actinobacteria bacterium]|nr:phosphoglycerate kinase [Actinomycetota bacterium]
MRTLNDLPDLIGKRVILRCDLNVPLDGSLITDDGRIRASLPTIRYLIEQGSKVIIISHLGRPDGEVVAKYSLHPVAKRLAELLGQPVGFVNTTVGVEAESAVNQLNDGEVLVLENLRFNPGEASKDVGERETFAGELAKLGDFLVSDGFGVVHRKQASVYELAKKLPSTAGLLIDAELKVLEKLTENPEKPYLVVLGGSKVSDKLGVIDHLLPRVDALLIGGGMLFTFLAAQGFKVGSSLLEADQIETVRSYLSKANELGVEIYLPSDVLVAEKFATDAKYETVPANQIESSSFGSNGIGLDIG